MGQLSEEGWVWVGLLCRRKMTQGGRERAGLVSFARSLDFIPRAKGTEKRVKAGQTGWGQEHCLLWGGQRLATA